MFFVINKSKIYSYMIALSTVVILFMAVAKLNDVVSTSENIVETGTNAICSNIENTNSEKSNVGEINEIMNSLKNE